MEVRPSCERLLLEPVFSVRYGRVTGAKLCMDGEEPDLVAAALALAEAWKKQSGFEYFYVCLAEETTASLALLRPVLRLLHEAPEARTMLCLVCKLGSGCDPGQLKSALTLLSALDMELCLALDDPSATTLLQAATLPLDMVQMSATRLFPAGCRPIDGLEELFSLADQLRLHTAVWEVGEHILVSKLLALGCQCILGKVVGPPVTESEFLQIMREGPPSKLV